MLFFPCSCFDPMHEKVLVKKLISELTDDLSIDRHHKSGLTDCVSHLTWHRFGFVILFFYFSFPNPTQMFTMWQVCMLKTCRLKTHTKCCLNLIHSHTNTFDFVGTFSPPTTSTESECNFLQDLTLLRTTCSEPQSKRRWTERAAATATFACVRVLNPFSSFCAKGEI